jgi:hypothetical protein
MPKKPSKPKKPSNRRLYEVRLERGRNHPEWKGFYEGVERLNGKSPDFGGINNVAIVGTHHDQMIVKSIISGEMGDNTDLSVVEITKKTLESPGHRVYSQLINDYFLPYNNYPAVED